MRLDKRSKQRGPNSQYDAIRKKINNQYSKYMNLELHKTPLDQAAISKGRWPGKIQPTRGAQFITIIVIFMSDKAMDKRIVIFQINRGWKTNKLAKGKINKRRELAKQLPK